jgi:hypothetical protein
MGVDFRMVKSRKTTLKDHASRLLVIEDKSVYFNCPGNDNTSPGRYTVCGLWYESKKTCPNDSACIFPLGFTKKGEISHRVHDVCKYDDKKVRANILTKKKIIKLVGPNYQYVTKW